MGVWTSLCAPRLILLTLKLTNNTGREHERDQVNVYIIILAKLLSCGFFQVNINDCQSNHT
jgi:hypothetical protein